MAWYDPTSWSSGDVGNAVWQAATLGLGGAITDDPAAEQERARKALLQQQAQAAGQFADTSAGNYQTLGLRGSGALDALQRQAQGQDSVSALQLQQALQQNVAAQRSLAAGASPQNAAMAARTAAIQTGRLGAGLAGQQALAGLQERNQAQQAYAQLLQGLRGQDLNATLGSRQTATQGYGAANAGMPEKSWIEKYGPAVQGGLSAAAKTMSDRLLKTDVRDGAPDANKAIDSLRAYAYRYKDPQYGEGPQVGVMAQDLEKAGLGQAVVNTPAGKAIDPGKLSGANTAMIAALGRRVAELERAPTFQSNAADAVTADTPQQRDVRAREAALFATGDQKAIDEQHQLNRRRMILGEQDNLRRYEATKAAVQQQTGALAALQRQARGQ
jgi:hypothetical protein